MIRWVRSGSIHAGRAILPGFSVTSVAELFGDEPSLVAPFANRPCLRLALLHGSLWPMNIISQGIDLVECSRIAAILDRHQKRFLFRVLTAKEREAASRFADAIPHISGRFAAKEAVLKALGTGWRGQISWKDIEVTNNSLGKPEVQLSGECSRIAQKLGVTRILLSISHTRTHAVASAITLDDKN